VWRREVPGEPTALRPAATAAAAEAVRCGVAADREPWLALAIHEALANAREHGHLGAVDVHLRVEVAVEATDAVAVRVADLALGGAWAPDGSRDDGGGPGAIGAGERGRGLVLIRALADGLAVSSGDEGTELTLRFHRSRPAGGDR
jgi:anti-sigma regulatory factor (Ser/Thr protein kinase)